MFAFLNRLIDSILAPKLSTPPFWDDFWFTPVGQRTHSGVQINENTALNYSAVWAATRLLAGTGSCLPFNLYRRRADGGKEIATDERLHTILHDEANPEMSAMMFRATRIAQQVNSGNAYAEIERDRVGRVMALWPIHSSRVIPVRDESSRLVYDVQVQSGSEVVRFPARDIFHVSSIISADGIVGMGVIEAARDSIGFGVATERHGAAFFGNGARPGIVVTHPGKLTETARENFRREWNELHQGADKAGKLALLQEGADVKILSLSPEDSQFIATRQHNIEEIARWYGVPPHLIQHLLRSTFNNIETQGIEFVVYSLIPWLKLWEQEVWRKLLTVEQRKRFFAKHVVDALHRGDAQSRTNALQQQFFNGALTLDEWREIEDRNPLPNGLGKKHFIQVSMAPIENVVANSEATEAPVASVESEAPNENESSDSLPTTNEGAAAQGSLQAAVLNGQQITGLTGIADKLMQGVISPVTAKAMIRAAFPLMQDGLIENIVEGIVKFEAEKEPVEPEPEEEEVPVPGEHESQPIEPEQESESSDGDETEDAPDDSNEDPNRLSTGIFRKVIRWMLGKGGNDD